LTGREIGNNRFIYECVNGQDDSFLVSSEFPPIKSPNTIGHTFDIVYGIKDGEGIVSYTSDVIFKDKVYRLSSTKRLSQTNKNQKRTVLYKIGKPIVLEKIYLPYENGLINNVEKVLKLSAFM
jgi:hypothetical protein